MNIRLIAFTDRGETLAKRLGEHLTGTVTRCGESIALSRWTEQSFHEADGLVFVGAVGIAVRAIAPYLRGKSVDPAVVVVDETGRFAVSLVSGHLGGANDLTRWIAAICGAVPVITTATDLRGVFAVDEWAKRQGCVINNPDCIKRVSAKLLAGETVRIGSEWPVRGIPPEGVQLTENRDFDAYLSVHTAGEDILHVIPKIVVLGVGCKRGTPCQALEDAFQTMCAGEGIFQEAFYMVCSIDRKRDEPGLVAFCQAHKLPLCTFSAEELQAVSGTFSGSAFVRSVTGADNICERSAVKGSEGELLIPKQAGNGITMAAAAKPFEPDWRWQYG